MNPHTPLLLRLIYARADVKRLINNGLSYSQIATLIAEGIQSGLIVESDEELQLTEAGLKLITTDPARNERRKDGGWIAAADKWRIDKMSPDDIYLSRDVHFLNS